MHIKEYTDYDATGLAELIRGGEVTAAELQGIARGAIQEVNPQVNAVVGELFDEPLSYESEGPFAGVPFAIKDLGLHAAGVPTRMGTRLTGDGVSFPQDTGLMARFRAAGLATLGRTTSPEFGFNPSTESLATGPTRNPWDTTRTGGGSSGGAVALVASRALPVAHASDGGGSIRIPASWTGLVGLKPTRGRISEGPDVDEGLFGLSTDFAVTRTVRDAAAMLDAVHGSGIGDKYIIAPPDRPYAEEIRTAPGRLRVAFMTGTWSGVPVDPQHVAAVRSVAKQLEAAGHSVEEATPDVDWDTLMNAQVPIWSSNMAFGLTELSKSRGVAIGPDTVEAVSLTTYETGRNTNVLDLFAALRVCNATTRSVSRWFVDYDVLLTPTVAQLPPKLGYLNQNDPTLDVRGWIDKIFAVCPYTLLFNVTGHPAMNLPLVQSTEGLPIGLQFVAPYGDEATLFRLAAQLEEAMPWIDRRPAVSAGSAEV